MADTEEKGKSKKLAVVLVRGMCKVNHKIKDTMKLLGLNRVNQCVVLESSLINIGMLKKIKDYVTWGDINNDILRLLLQKRARKKGNKRITKEEVEVLVDRILADKKMILDIKPVFRLTPPSKGFKHSIKQHYPKGELGYRGEKINDLLKRMI